MILKGEKPLPNPHLLNVSQCSLSVIAQDAILLWRNPSGAGEHAVWDSMSEAAVGQRTRDY